MKKNKREGIKNNIIACSTIVIICGFLMVHYNARVMTIIDYLMDAKKYDSMSDIFLPISIVILALYTIFLVIPFIIAIIFLVKSIFVLNRKEK